MNSKPYLFVVTGRSGSGKTTFSRELGRQMNLPVISRDELKEGYVHTFGKSHSELLEDSNQIVTETFFKTVYNLLNDHVSLICEAAFQNKLWEPQLNLIKERVRIFLLICKAGDDRRAFDRATNRDLEDPMRVYYHGNQCDKYADGIEIPPYVEPDLDVPTIHIDTTGDYKPL